MSHGVSTRPLFEPLVMVRVPVNGKPTEIDITEPLGAACESMLPPVIETMVDLLTRVEPEYQERVRNHVILAGGTALIGGLDKRLERELAEIGGGRVKVVKDPIYCGSDGGLAIALDAPETDWEKLAS